MNTLLIILILIVINLLNCFPLIKIIKKDKMNNDLLFIGISNSILTISFLFFYIFVPNLMFAFYIAFFEMIFAYLLIFNIKNILGRYSLYTIPYFFVWVYIFSNLFILYLF